MISKNLKMFAAEHNCKRHLTKDSPVRSLIKAVSWRVTGTFDTILISFLITGKLKFALSIGFIELITKTSLYYFHERTWDKISFGKRKMDIDYQI